jgi:hypothetical protein
VIKFPYRERIDRPTQQDACAIDQDVQLSKAFDGQLDCFTHCFHVGAVGLDS